MHLQMTVLANKWWDFSPKRVQISTTCGKWSHRVRPEKQHTKKEISEAFCYTVLNIHIIDVIYINVIYIYIYMPLSIWDEDIVSNELIPTVVCVKMCMYLMAGGWELMGCFTVSFQTGYSESDCWRTQTGSHTHTLWQNLLFRTLGLRHSFHMDYFYCLY